MLRIIAVVACLLAFLLSPAAQAFGPQLERPAPAFVDLFKIPVLSPADHWCCPLPWWLAPGQAIMQATDVGSTFILRK
jgi:hypothetical protein